jgi:hypothetical protein
MAFNKKKRLCHCHTCDIVTQSALASPPWPGLQLEEFVRLGLWRPEEFVLQDSWPQAEQLAAGTPVGAAAAAAAVTAAPDQERAVPRPSDAEQERPVKVGVLLASREREGEEAADEDHSPEQGELLWRRSATADAASDDAPPARIAAHAGVAMGVLALAVAGMAWTVLGRLKQTWRQRYDSIARH